MSEGRTKLLIMDTWNHIRFDFTEEEKAKLNAAIIGETICPKGCVLDLTKLGTDLETKLSSYAWTPKPKA